VGSERVANLRLLFPAITSADVASWSAFFNRAAQLEATYTAEQLEVRGDTGRAEVAAAYRFVPRGGGVQREERERLTMSFTKTPTGWRIASVQQKPKK
jgi:hypothetical protein